MQRVRAPLTGKRGRGMTGERGNGEQSENGVEQLFQLADRFNPAIETAAGDLRDLLIDVQRGMTKPWDDLLQIDQEARVRPSELSAEKVTRKLAFPLLSSAFGAKVEQVNVKEKGVAAKFGILHDGDEVLVDTLVHMNMRGRSVVSVLVDPESYMGARAPATSRRDQGDLPLEDQPCRPRPTRCTPTTRARSRLRVPARPRRWTASMRPATRSTTRNSPASTLSTNPKSGRRLTRLQKRRSSKPMPPLPRTAGSSESRSGSRQVS